MMPEKILEEILLKIQQNIEEPHIYEGEILSRVQLVSRNNQNRACVRLILACSLAKIHKPRVDIRKPYTEITGDDSFSGRGYDEEYISPFVLQNQLPCNSTTAFLTPALRNQSEALTLDRNLAGRPKAVYDAMLQLLDDIYQQRISAYNLLAETVRQLLILKVQNQQRLDMLLSRLEPDSDILLSAEAIVTLIQQHLTSRASSRLPVLIVAAAYKTIEAYLEERILPLEAHNAADKQTKALGDIQIALIQGEDVITVYEIKMKRVIKDDIDIAVQKIAVSDHRIDNYIFITTDSISQEVQVYAASMYDRMGVEIVVLDCIGFLRYFLHLFHRLRIHFLDQYQSLVLSEADSAVNQSLKEVFLALRQAAERGE